MMMASYLFLALAAQPAEEAPVPLTLDAALEIALERANAMIQARQDLVLVDVEYMEALSAVLPRFDLNLSGGEFFAGRRIIESRNPVPAQLPTEFPQVVFGPFVDAETNNYSNPQFDLALSGRQLIYDGGRWWTAIDRVDDVREARRAALRGVKNRVRAQVVRGFYELEKARRAIETFEAQIRVDEAQVERAQAILRAGRGSPADVATALRNLARDEIQLEDFLVQENAARRGFNLVLGRSPQTPVRLTLPPAVATATLAAGRAEVAPLGDLLDTALRHRPELEELRSNLEALRKDVDIAAADFWPLVTLDARYSRSSRRPDRIFGNPFQNYIATLDLTLQWNLFEGRATQARVERARITVKKQLAEFDELRRQTAGEVEAARRELVRQLRVYRVAQRQIEAAEEAVRLARGLFEAGRGTALELRDAELGLTQARLTATNARLDIEVAEAQLAQAVGRASTATGS